LIGTPKLGVPQVEELALLTMLVTVGKTMIMVLGVLNLPPSSPYTKQIYTNSVINLSGSANIIKKIDI
jgi:hypothetical protein